MEEGDLKYIIALIAIVLTLIIGSLVTLFVVFQRRKTNLLLEKEEEKQNYTKAVDNLKVEVREQTLRNISWELHDNIGQLLTLSKVQLQSLECDPVITTQVGKTITKALDELRALSKLINPDYTQNIKLHEAINNEIERFNRMNFLKATFTTKGKLKAITPDVELIIFRILQEFFTNTIKHAKATKLDVIMEYKSDSIEISAKDNGVGFDKDEDNNNGIGLSNINERAKLIDLQVDLKTTPYEGTSINIVCNCEEND